MYNPSAPTFSLANFVGPLELLLYLIQKDEIDVCSIAIRELTSQLIETLEATPEVETSSEALILMATLLLMKSQKLLPQDEGPLEVEEDPRVEMIQGLIEYCRLKEAAKRLSMKEEEQKAHFPRAISPFRKELGSGLEEVGIDHLKMLLGDILKRSANTSTQTIKEDEWQISHKLAWLKEVLSRNESISFVTLFAEGKSRMELIVLFLALLEMMKHQEVKVIRREETVYVTRTQSH